MTGNVSRYFLNENLLVSIIRYLKKKDVVIKNSILRGRSRGKKKINWNKPLLKMEVHKGRFKAMNKQE